MKKIAILISLFFITSCGDNDSSTPTTAEEISIVLKSGAYKYSNNTVEKSCYDYLSSSTQDGNYWVDPDGDGGIDAFIVTCDMANGGFSVFEKSFSYTNDTDKTIELFSAADITKLNSIRNISSSIEVTSDLSMTFRTDTTAGGCGNAPLIVSGTMEVRTLEHDDFIDNSITTRDFYGSSDGEYLQFDNSTNSFTYTFTNDCGVSTRFGVNTKVIIASVKVLTQVTSRADSKLSGTFYKVKLK